METALSTLSILPSNKEQVKVFSHKLKNEILANDKDPLKILVQLKMIEKIIADILKDDDIDSHFLKEFLLYEKEKEIEVNGAKLRQQETGVKYDYAGSGDLKWMELQEKIEKLLAEKKEREKFLQNIPMDNNGIVDPDSGVFIIRASKTSKTKVVVKL